MAASEIPDPGRNSAPTRKRMPLAVALVAQIIAGVAVFGTALIVTRITAWQPPLIILLALLGLFAALLGRRFGLAKWWTPIQIALPVSVAATLAWQVPGWVFPAAFAVLLLVFWNSARGGVPLYLTNKTTKAALAKLLPPDGDFRFADLGCGMGGPVLDLSGMRPNGHFTGIESAPALFLAAWLRCRLNDNFNADIIFGDFWSRDLAGFDVVYCFLSPLPMPALFEKACLEMKPGSLLISNSFGVTARPADDIIEVGDARKTKLYLWRM
jgi:hypothetical protein